MAIIPNSTGVARGIVGTWANMEEDNARTAFAGSEFVAGTPLMQSSGDTGSGNMVVAPLATGNRFVGIALRTVDMAGTPDANGNAKFAVNQRLGVAEMGVVYVLAGDDVVAGGVPYYNPATGKYEGASATGLLPLNNCEFDETASDGEPVALRIRIAPGAANVTAAS